jgi:hypothetical protein
MRKRQGGLRPAIGAAVSLLFATTALPSLAMAQAVGAVSPQNLQEIQQALETLRAEEAAAKAADQARAERIDALARQLARATGQPLIEAPASVSVAAMPAEVPNPPISGIVGQSTPGEGYWGSHDGGKGFTVAKTDVGELNISGYVLGRWIDQEPDELTYTDHLGREQLIDPRNDIQFHRMMLFMRGWLLTPKLRYDLTSWAVLSTGQATLIGGISYEFNKAVTVGVGMQRNQGTQTMHFNHPYWFSSDRVMADEFFRPGFSSSVYVMGEPTPGFRYVAVVSPTLSQLGVNAKQLTRDYIGSMSLWWMPTTKEFGPKEGFGDFENHQRVATLFNVSYLQGRENAFNNLSTDTPDQTTIRLSDSLQLYAMDALAPGVQVLDADISLLSLGAGVKYKGWALHGEGYWRDLTNFNATGPLPVEDLHDTGFYLQTGYMVLPKTLELYASTSYVFGEFNDSNEYIGGLNWFPFKTRNVRYNAQLIHVDRAAASSTFGFYVGGMTGFIASMGVDMIF